MSGCHAARLRCPVCGNPDWHAIGTAEECTHCGLVVADPAALRTAATAIPARLEAGRAGPDEGDRWSLSAAAWRNAAWRYGRILTGTRVRPAVPCPHGVTLAMMTRPSEWDAAMAALRSLRASFDRIVVAIDADDATGLTLPKGVMVAVHRLDGDFAAQRNRLQAMARSGWVLQLDSDERPSAALLDALGWLVAAADQDGLTSLGLPRTNLVDGRRSALWPDIQYRLNRAEVRYAGRVHERPVVPFARTSLALAGAIEHRLDRSRVRTRTDIYGAMAADGARVEDEVRLLRDFDPIADR